jgi:hypothetical protein
LPDQLALLGSQQIHLQTLRNLKQKTEEV